MGYLDEPVNRDVFILGAGFSRAVSKAMPLMSDLMAAVSQRFGKESPGAPNTPFIDSDIELALNYLAQSNPWMEESTRLRNRALLLELSSFIGTLIDERTTEALRSSPMPPTPLLRFVHWLHAKRAIVVTFNYDTLLEQALECVAVRDYGSHLQKIDPRHLYPIPLTRVLPDLFAFPDLSTAEVLKLHGSQNWFYSGRPEYSGEPLYYTHVSPWGSHDPVPDRLLVGGRVPLIIPPLSDKSGLFGHEQIRFLWRRAAMALRTAKRIYCIGYSLPRTDLTVRYLLHANQPGKTVPFYLVNRPRVKTPEGNQISIQDHFRALLPDGYEVEYTHVSENPLEPFIEELLNGDPITVGAPVEASDELKDRVVQIVEGKGMSGYDADIRSIPFKLQRCSTGVILLIDTARIPVLVKWECFGQIVEVLRRSPDETLGVGEIDEQLQAPIPIVWYLSSVLEDAHIATRIPFKGGFRLRLNQDSR
jgi:hypothetical protein